MADVIPLDPFDRNVARERARVVQAMRDLIDRIETAPEAALRDVLPIAASGIDELARRLAPWLR